MNRKEREGEGKDRKGVLLFLRVASLYEDSSHVHVILVVFLGLTVIDHSGIACPHCNAQKTDGQR